MVKLGAKELRVSKPSLKDLKKLRKNPIYIVVDNVLDAYNVGGIFRLADAVSAEKVILCGETETPPHTRIKKASINTTEWVAWSYASTAVEALQELKTQNSKLLPLNKVKKVYLTIKLNINFQQHLLWGTSQKASRKKF